MLILLDKKFSLEETLSAIACADDEELSEIIRTLIQTYANRYPDQETLFLTLPKYDAEDRHRILDALKEFQHQ